MRKDLLFNLWGVAPERPPRLSHLDMKCGCFGPRGARSVAPERPFDCRPLDSPLRDILPNLKTLLFPPLRDILLYLHAAS